MRARFGVAMPAKGGRTAVVGVEVRERRGSDGLLDHEFVVGYVERVGSYTVDGARERVAALMNAAKDVRPCAIVDVGSPQGLALQQSLRGAYDPELHRPHAYPGAGMRTALFASFLRAYSEGRVRFVHGLAHRADLDRALVFYMGGGTSKDGVDLSSEDEALVVALGLAMFWPKHGPAAAKAAESDA